MARKEQFTMRIEPETREFLERYGKVSDDKNDITLCGQLREDMQTFQEIVTTAERGLNEHFEFSEAMLIVDVLNSFYFLPGHFPSLPEILAAEVDDGCRLNGLGLKWQLNREAIVKKLQALTPIEAYAVFHMARIVWAMNGEGNFSENVQRIFRCTNNGGNSHV